MWKAALLKGAREDLDLRSNRWVGGVYVLFECGCVCGVVQAVHLVACCMRILEQAGLWWWSCWDCWVVVGVSSHEGALWRAELLKGPCEDLHLHRDRWAAMVLLAIQVRACHG